MEKEPDTRHDLILSIRLNRAPLDLEKSLATNEERNECTQAFCDWEDLIERQKSGDDSVTDGDIYAAYDHAMWLDAFVLEKDTIARQAYQDDYPALAKESSQPVYDSLKAMFGENVTWPTLGMNSFALRANRDDLLQLQEVVGIDRVSLDMRMTGYLDVSRVNIQADKVNNGYQGVGPYTGSDVKVAIIDDGYDTGHGRLPTVATENQLDDVDVYDIGTCIDRHGTNVAGVVFCEPDTSDPPDSKVGIASEAIPVIAKVKFHLEGANCQVPGVGETWTVDKNAFSWAINTESGFPGVKIINFSRGPVIYGYNGGEEYGRDPAVDTLASDYSALDVDWYVYSKDVCFLQACGNTDVAPQLAPPSGSYNCISVGAYDDLGTSDRNNDRIWAGSPYSVHTSPGPTDDGRKKPDISAPGVNINTTHRILHGFVNATGTSFAAPHVAGVCALLKEAKPSITARQIKAVLINSVEKVVDPDNSNLYAGNGSWHNQGGWGALDAYNAVKWRNKTFDDSIIPETTKSYVLVGTVAEGEVISVTCVWHRNMVSATQVVAGSPGNLNLYLDVWNGSSYDQVASSASGPLDIPGTVFDNVEQVYYVAPAAGSYRVRVERADLHHNFLAQGFTLAARRTLIGTLGP